VVTKTIIARIVTNALTVVTVSDLKVENLLLDENKDIKIIGKCLPRWLCFVIFCSQSY